ncbi:hypothetical protein LguiA_025291 [Lonicera macranthoides]
MAGGRLLRAFSLRPKPVDQPLELGWDSVDRVMTSWKTSEDPSDGEYSFRFDSPGLPQLVIEQKMVHQYRWGPWDGSRFSGTDAFKWTEVCKAVVFIFNPEEISLMFDVFDDTVLFRFLLTSSGTIQLVEWNNRTKNGLKWRIHHPRQIGWITPGGCKRKYDLNCSGGGDGFVKYDSLKLSDYSIVRVEKFEPQRMS